MKAKARLKYLRISPRKVRLVADMIRNKKVEEAEKILRFTTKAATKPISKLLESATANAENNFQLDKSNLYVSKIMVGEGPTLKRYRFRGFGRIFQVRKRTSHIYLELEETVASADKAKESRRTRAPKVGKKEPSRKMEEKEAVQAEGEEKKAGKEEKPVSVTDIPDEPRRERRKEREADFPRPKFGKKVRRIFRRKSF